MNRLTEYFDPLEPERDIDNYWIIETTHDSFAVSKETASEVERQLGRRWRRPRWLIFHSLTGARHRVLLRQIYRISECTAEQRARGRKFMRAREKEEEQDGRPWDD
ncbi:MAG TPA: hypothetical protein VHM30_19720 [Gemmatimonadaceae bacterium]|nr:hypothetical protein [Gemmatimonadaceae bacterium]